MESPEVWEFGSRYCKMIQTFPDGYYCKREHFPQDTAFRQKSFAMEVKATVFGYTLAA